MPGAATDELERFLAKQDGAGPRTTDEISLDLVLAEHAAARAAALARRRSRALEDAAEPAPQPGAAGARTDDDARRAETRQRAAIDLAPPLTRATGGALGSRRPDEPLDVAVVRGACEARAGDAARATEDWRGLVRQCRGLAQALADGGGGADVEDYYDEQARLVDAVLDALGDLAPAVTEQMHELLAALLDAAARLHGARAAVEEDRAGGSPHRGDEARARDARAPAPRARRARRRAGPREARPGGLRGFRAGAGRGRGAHGRGARRRARVGPRGGRRQAPQGRGPAAGRGRGPAAPRRRRRGRRVGGLRSRWRRVGVARDAGDARRLVAVAAAVLESSCAGDALAPEAAALAGAAVAVAPGARKALAAGRRGAPRRRPPRGLRPRVRGRRRRVAAGPAPRGEERARALLRWPRRWRGAVAGASVGDLIAVHAVGLRPVDDGALARVAAQRGVDAVRAAGGPDACAASRASGGAAAAGDPRDKEDGGALRGARGRGPPAAGAAAVAAAATVHARSRPRRRRRALHATPAPRAAASR
ncbi:hypothetical protein JL720_295 [Aureococcus anophagefferens]|nr:hypothetical protein JL720_295 [Aureococcus anophagefferens]